MIGTCQLDAVPMFASLGRAARVELGGGAVESRFARGESLWFAGEPARGLFVVRSGHVRIVGSRGGRQYVLHTGGPGDTLGEVPLFGGAGYPASATATETTRCLVIGAGPLRAAMAADPALAWKRWSIWPSLEYPGAGQSNRQGRRMRRKKKIGGAGKTEMIVAEGRRARAEWDTGYRGQALKILPWVCGKCAREFDGRNLRDLTVHHKDHNHLNNPPDGSNWELLCVYCHDDEHSRHSVAEASGPGKKKASGPRSTYKPFADLEKLLKPDD